MTNIFHQILTLIEDAKAKAESKDVKTHKDVVADISGRSAAQTEATQDEAIAEADKKAPFMKLSILRSLRVLIEVFLKINNLDTVLEKCCHRDFNPASNTPIQSAISDSEVSLIKFSKDFINSCKNKQAEGLILSTLESKEYDFQLNHPLAYRQLNTFFARGNSKLTVRKTIDTKEFVDELKNFYVACNIVNYFCLDTFGRKHEGADSLLSFTKGQNTNPDYINSKQFKKLEMPTEKVMDNFLQSNTDASIFIKSFWGGEPDETDKAEVYKLPTNSLRGEAELKAALEKEVIPQVRPLAKLQHPSADVKIWAEAVSYRDSTDKANMLFFAPLISSATAWYLSMYLCSGLDELDMGQIFRGSVFDALSGSTTNQNELSTTGDAEVPDMDLPDTSKGADVLLNAIEREEFEIAETERKASDFRDMLSELYYNFGISEGEEEVSISLRSILLGVIEQLPEDWSEETKSYYIINEDGTISTSSLWKDLRNQAFSKDSGTFKKETVLNEIANILSMAGAENDLTEAGIKLQMSKLPKTIEAGRAAYAVTKQWEGSTASILDPASKKINAWYSKLYSESLRFYSELSPGLTQPVLDEYLLHNSNISKEFGLNFVFDTTSRNAKVASAKRRSAERNKDVTYENVSAAFDDYVAVVKDILDPVGLISDGPSKNLHTWGLLQTTLCSVKANKGAKKVVAFEVPGVTPEGIPPLFDSSDEVKAIATKVLTALNDSKEAFISAGSTAELSKLLQSVFDKLSDKEKKLQFFSSPDTVNSHKDYFKNKKLAFLLNPEYAIGSLLVKMEQNPGVTISAGGQPLTSAFMDFAILAIPFNALPKKPLEEVPVDVIDESILLLSYIKALFEDTKKETKEEKAFRLKKEKDDALEAEKKRLEDESEADRLAEIERLNKEETLVRERAEVKAYYDEVAEKERTKAEENKAKAAEKAEAKRAKTQAYLAKQREALEALEDPLVGVSTEDNDKKIAYIIINEHFRAKILLALLALFDSITIFLFITNGIIRRLKVPAKNSLREGKNTAFTKRVCGDLSEVLTSFLQLGDLSMEGKSEAIKSGIEKINASFHKSIETIGMGDTAAARLEAYYKKLEEEAANRR